MAELISLSTTYTGFELLIVVIKIFVIIMIISITKLLYDLIHKPDTEGHP